MTSPSALSEVRAALVNLMGYIPSYATTDQVNSVRALATLDAFLSQPADGAGMEEGKQRLDRLRYAARGGNATNDNVWMMRWLADRLVNVYGESPNVDFVRALRERAAMLEDVLSPLPAAPKPAAPAQPVAQPAGEEGR